VSEQRTTDSEVQFSEASGQTTVAIRQTYTKISPIGAMAIDGASVGWAQQLERYEEYLRSQLNESIARHKRGT
jgi:hypothetical protein